MSCACRSVGKPGKGAVDDNDGIDAGAVARDANAFVVRRDGRAGLGQHIQRRLQQFRPRAGELYVAAGHRHRHGVSPGLDAIRQHGVPSAVKLGDAFDDDARRACADDLRAHLVETIGDIGDLGLAGRIA